MEYKQIKDQSFYQRNRNDFLRLMESKSGFLEFPHSSLGIGKKLYELLGGIYKKIELEFPNASQQYFVNKFSQSRE